MAEIVIKPDPKHNEYVVWSTFGDRPVMSGIRAEVFEYLGGDVRPGSCPICRRWISETDTPSALLKRADEKGSSVRHRFGSGPGFGWWEDDEFRYDSTGVLHRADLVHAARLLADGREGDVLALLQPIEDET